MTTHPVGVVFLQSSPSLLLARIRSGLWGAHARLLIQKEGETEASLGGWAGSKEVAAIPDESHWGTLFLRHKLPMWGHLLTFMMPGDPRTGVLPACLLLACFTRRPRTHSMHTTL